MRSRNLLMLVTAFLMAISASVFAQVIDDEPELIPVPESSATNVKANEKVRFSINKKYIAMCEVELGPFPAETIHCPDAVLIPSVRSLPNGTITEVGPDLPPAIPRSRGEEAGQLYLNQMTQLFKDITTCDKPSGIFRDMRNAGCVPGNRIKHITNKINGNQIVDWVYICRKNTIYPRQDNHYNELGLIGYNRSTGKTCFFAGQPTETLKVTSDWPLTANGENNSRKEVDISLIDGDHIPSPKLDNFSQEVASRWSIPTFGGCTRCHSNGPFIRYPFNEPVCLVQGSSEKCMQSFADHNLCKAYQEKSFPDQQLRYSCKVLKPKRQPGQLYSVISPFDEHSELHKFLHSMSDADTATPYYNDLMKTPWNNPKRLVEKEASACMQCHDIGNEDYARLFVNSLFSMHLASENKRTPATNEHWRTRLFLSNLSDFQKESFHEIKLKTEGIFPIKVSAYSIELANQQRKDMSMEYYKKALHKINACAKAPQTCAWDSPWTLQRVEQEPLKYLQERCSFCHAPNMNMPVLVNETDFKREAIANRIIARINEHKTPMPPAGQLPDSVLDVLTNYLRH